MPFLDRYTEEQKTGGFLSRYTEEPVLKKSVPKKSVMDYYHKRLTLNQEKALEAYENLQRDLPGFVAGLPGMALSGTPVAQVMSPLAKVTEPIREKVEGLPIFAPLKRAEEKVFDPEKGLFPWETMPTPLTEQVKGIAKRVIGGEPISEIALDVAKATPGVGFIPRLIDEPESFIERPFPTIMDLAILAGGRHAIKSFRKTKPTEAKALEPEISFPGIKEKIVPSEKLIPPTVLEEVLGLKKKKAKGKKKPVPGEAELKLARKLKKRKVTGKDALPPVTNLATQVEATATNLRTKMGEGLNLDAFREGWIKDLTDRDIGRPLAEQAVDMGIKQTKAKFKKRGVTEKPAEIPAELEGLAEEARKYKTAKEFEEGIREAFHYKIPKGEMKVGDKITLSPSLEKFNIPLKSFYQAAQKARPSAGRAKPAYEKAKQLPKGGAVEMKFDNLQATASDIIGDRFGLRPKAVYDWATKHNIDLQENVIGKVTLERMTEAVLGDKPLAKPKPAAKAVKPAKPKTAEEFLTNAEKKARERIRKRGVTLKTGIDPGELMDYAIIGGAKIVRGTVEFGKWSAEMVREFGEAIKPHLRETYDHAVVTAKKYGYKEKKAPTGIVSTKPSVLGLNKAEIDLIRKDLNLDKLEPAKRKAFERSLEEAKKAKLDENALVVADEVLKSQRLISDTEHAGMVLKASRLANEYDARIKDIASYVEKGDMKASQMERMRADVIMDQLDKLTDAT